MFRVLSCCWNCESYIAGFYTVPSDFVPLMEMFEYFIQFSAESSFPQERLEWGEWGAPCPGV